MASTANKSTPVQPKARPRNCSARRVRRLPPAISPSRRGGPPGNGDRRSGVGFPAERRSTLEAGVGNSTVRSAADAGRCRRICKISLSPTIVMRLQASLDAETQDTTATQAPMPWLCQPMRVSPNCRNQWTCPPDGAEIADPPLPPPSCLRGRVPRRSSRFSSALSARAIDRRKLPSRNRAWLRSVARPHCRRHHRLPAA